jgi:alpha-galactosidase
MTLRFRIVCFLALLAFSVSLHAEDAHSVSNHLALTPPMGWNSWNKFACNVSEELVRQTADAMVKSGMKDAGYQYVVIDDCWQVSRDKDGNIVADPQRFPSGIKALADYILRPVRDVRGASAMNSRMRGNMRPGAWTI